MEFKCEHIEKSLNVIKYSRLSRDLSVDTVIMFKRGKEQRVEDA